MSGDTLLRHGACGDAVRPYTLRLNMRGTSLFHCAALFAVVLLSDACQGDGGSGPPPPRGTHVGYYVTTTGTAGGTGSTDDPWDLATALNGGNGAVHGGDTVWIRAGTYAGTYRTSLDGTEADRIIFRAYPGERAKIDGLLRAYGSYLTFWGLEIMQSNPVATYDRVLEANTVNGRFISLLLHDAGVSAVSMAADGGSGVELYGSIIYNNGVNESHGIYAHNATTGTKYITDNVIFNNCARGIQVYQDAGGTLIRNIVAEGNIAFNNGTLSTTATRVNLLFNGEVPISGMVGKNNMLYYSPGTDGYNIRVGTYGAANNKSVTLTGNYAAGGRLGISMPYQWDAATVQGNTFLGDDSTAMVLTSGPISGYAWSDNDYYRDPTATAWKHDGTSYTFADWKATTGVGGSDQTFATGPDLTQVFVRPNKYEPGRAFIAVYNWGGNATVQVNVAGIVPAGANYEVRNVQALFGAPITSGTYSGGSIMIPLGGVTPPAPIGRVLPPAPKTGPAFDVFLLTSTGP